MNLRFIDDDWSAWQTEEGRWHNGLVTEFRTRTLWTNLVRVSSWITNSPRAPSIHNNGTRVFIYLVIIAVNGMKSIDKNCKKKKYDRNGAPPPSVLLRNRDPYSFIYNGAVMNSAGEWLHFFCVCLTGSFDPSLKKHQILNVRKPNCWCHLRFVSM